jgi:Raf kinase inhibitor-like YbhB/YbcL family protein
MPLNPAIIGAVTIAAALAATISPDREGSSEAAAPTEMSVPVADLVLTSPAFAHETPIPLRYSAYAEELTPPLEWSGAPEGTLSYALILDDPDDGARPYVHWVLYNIPASLTGLPEGLTGEGVFTEPETVAGVTQGLNNRRRASYYGPEPRRGDPPHGYRFTLYALTAEPTLAEGLNAEGLREAMAGKIAAETVLVGRFAAPPAE